MMRFGWMSLSKLVLLGLAITTVYLYYHLNRPEKEMMAGDHQRNLDKIQTDSDWVPERGIHESNQKKNLASPQFESIQSKSVTTISMSNSRTAIHLCVVACGDRLKESLIMLKSAIILANSYLFLHIFAEKELHPAFKDGLEFWPPMYKTRFRYTIYPISLHDEWKTMYRMCGTQRLFIPDRLADIDSVLYVDSDILFMRPIDDVWYHFLKFNSSQVASLSPEHEDASTGWYNRFASHPYYGKLGVNSGVMLMNLTRMRQMNWTSVVEKYYHKYKTNIVWGDQDIINIIFHFHPDKLYICDCDWNFRPDHCMYMSVCKQAERNGISVLHGSRETFRNTRQPAFKAIYEAFESHMLGMDKLSDLVRQVKANLSRAPDSNCGKIGQALTKQLQITSEKKQ